MKLPLLVLLTISFLLNSQAQESFKTTKVQLGFGIESVYFKAPNFDNQWSIINPNFNEPDLLDTGFISENYSYYNSSTRLNLSYQIKKQVKNSGISVAPRIQISYGNGFHSFQSWIKNVEYAYDTLTSSVTGEQIFIDSIITQQQIFSMATKCLSAKLGLNFDIDITKQLTLYSGIEIVYAKHFTINQENNSVKTYNISEIDDYLYRSKNQKISEQNIVYNKYTATYFPIKINELNIGIPIGMKFRLSKKENLLNHFLLSYEYNFNHSYFKIRSVYQKNVELARFNQFQHSHFVRIMYEL